MPLIQCQVNQREATESHFSDHGELRQGYANCGKSNPRSLFDGVSVDAGADAREGQAGEGGMLTGRGDSVKASWESSNLCRFSWQGNHWFRYAAVPQIECLARDDATRNASHLRGATHIPDGVGTVAAPPVSHRDRSFFKVSTSCANSVLPV
jgi:hypothetical protein